MYKFFKTETEDYSIRKILCEKNIWGYGVSFGKKRKLCLQNLTKEWKQTLVGILQQANFCNIFILCQQIRIIIRSDQGFQLMNFPSQIFFNDIDYKAALLEKHSQWLLSIYVHVAFYCYFEKGHRTNARSLSIFILFQLQS